MEVPVLDGPEQAENLAPATQLPIGIHARILEQLPGIVYIFDIKINKIIYLNKDVEDVWGYSNEEMLSMENPASQFLDEEGLKVFIPHLMKALSLEIGASHNFVVHIPHKSGEFRWYKHTLSPLEKIATGECISLLGYSEDVTERHLLEEKIATQTVWISQAQKLSGLGSFTSIVNDPILTVSPSFCEIIGFPITEKVDSASVLDLIHPDDIESAKEILQKFYDNQFDIDYKYRIITSNNETRYMEGKMAPRFNDNGVLIGSHGYLQDVTQNTIETYRAKRAETFLLESQSIALIGRKNALFHRH